MIDVTAKKRYLCSQLVPLRWSSRGAPCEAVGNLESIWTTGAEVCLETPIPERTVLHIRTRQREWRGLVRGCRQGEQAFYIEIRFLPMHFWSRRRFVPEHLFDPSALWGFGRLSNA